MGGTTLVAEGQIVKMSSTPPLAPSKWPIWLFVLEMLVFLACSPKMRLIARVSARSPSDAAGAVSINVANVSRIQLGIG